MYLLQNWVSVVWLSLTDSRVKLGASLTNSIIVWSVSYLINRTEVDPRSRCCFFRPEVQNWKIFNLQFSHLQNICIFWLCVDREIKLINQFFFSGLRQTNVIKDSDYSFFFLLFWLECGNNQQHFFFPHTVEKLQNRLVFYTPGTNSVRVRWRLDALPQELPLCVNINEHKSGLIIINAGKMTRIFE